MKKTIEVELSTIDTIRKENSKLYQKIIDKYRNINVEDDWYQYTIEDLTTILGFCGFSDIKIGFSGFWSQGDGANFTGIYRANAVDFKALKEYVPNETAIYERALSIYNQVMDFENPDFTLYRTSSHYAHENTVSIKDTEFPDSTYPETEENILQDCRDIMHVIYMKLEEEYNYLTSESAIYETLECNEYYFNDKGEIVE